MTEAAHTKAEVGLARMVAIWQHGEAAEQDPVLINMLAREVADLNRLVPGAVDKVRNAFEDMKARGLSMAEATEGWP
ncbi:hypothetical protein [Brevundimonas pondensis]|uniref:Uncharacterized protein n=1 Tax=Brevundimonas pondensis TaxID=2774189 RepID=A0ABX7SKK4_9CAUL|nr:hypothetical protein [Brevundimonas pondensis]QTC88204.1 hypothetical protein IFE19_02000 [Brevundimonas pondensis]